MPLTFSPEPGLRKITKSFETELDCYHVAAEVYSIQEYIPNHLGP